MRLRYVLASVLVVITASVSQADEIDRFIESQMAQRGIPGLAFAVVEKGEVRDLRCYGSANLETETPVSPESVFEIASLTKPLTATAILRLVDSALVALDDPIVKYIEDAPAEWGAITVGHLLSHTGGFAEQLIVSANGVPLMDVSTEAQFELVKESPLMFPAGRGASYSDPGYFLLGMIIERASGQRYADAMQALVFDPCGMEHSLILDQWRIVDGRVAGYTLRDGMLLNARRDWQHELPSFFGVMTTVGDLAKFELAYAGGELLSDDLAERMQTPTRLADGTVAEVFGKQYGLGWQVGDYRGYQISEHGGFSGTFLLRFPDEHFAVIVLTNLDVRSGSRPDLLARGIAGLADSRFLRPDMLEPDEDSNESDTRRLEELCSRAVSWSNESALSTAFRRRWAAMPAWVKEGRAGVLGSIESLDFVGRDAGNRTGLTHFDEGVHEIRYYRGNTPRGEIYMTIWLDDAGEIIDMEYYRP